MPRSSYIRKPHEKVLKLFKGGEDVKAIAKKCMMHETSVWKRLRECVKAGVISEEEYRHAFSSDKDSEKAGAGNDSSSNLTIRWKGEAKEQGRDQSVASTKKKASLDIYTTTLNALTKARVPIPVPEIARLLDMDEGSALDVLRSLKEQGFNIVVEDGLVELYRQLQMGNRIKIRMDDYCKGDLKRIGFITDTHLCSKYAREDVLETAYDIFKEEKIGLVFHAGNIIDGYSKRINHFDLMPGLTGYTAQVQYLVDHYPQRKGIETWYITGDDHEGWWIKDAGLNIGEYIELKARQKGRTDLKFIGHMESDIELAAPKGTGWLRTQHPGGGSAYAVSYTTQKTVESFQGGEKPHILLVGHFHKFNHDFPREVHTVQGGCTQDQTPFLRKKRIQCHVGFCIIEFHQAETGEINRFKVEWINFYDRGFYKKHDRYVSW